MIRVGTLVAPGDILVGKVVPKSKSELSPEEKLLHAIFGRMGEDVKKDCLEVPSGIDGIVIDAQKFQRKAYHSEEEKAKVKKEKRLIEDQYKTLIDSQIERLCGALERETASFSKPLKHKTIGKVVPEKLIDEIDPKKLRRFLSGDNFDFASSLPASSPGLASTPLAAFPGTLRHSSAVPRKPSGVIADVASRGRPLGRPSIRELVRSRSHVRPQEIGRAHV